MYTPSSGSQLRDWWLFWVIALCGRGALRLLEYRAEFRAEVRAVGAALPSTMLATIELYRR